MKRKQLFFSHLQEGVSYFLCTLAIATGAVLYMSFRTHTLLVFNWLRPLHPEKLFAAAAHPLRVLFPHLPQWMVFSLPDGLWAFSYSLFISTLWSHRNSPARILWMASIPLVVLGFELLQLTPLVPGTFCRVDICLEASGILLGMYPLLNRTKPAYHEKTNP